MRATRRPKESPTPPGDFMKAIREHIRMHSRQAGITLTVPNATHMIECSCGTALDLVADDEAAAIAEFQKRHQCGDHDCEITVQPVDHTTHPLHKKYRD